MIYSTKHYVLKQKYKGKICSAEAKISWGQFYLREKALLKKSQWVGIWRRKIVLPTGKKK